MSKSGRSSPTPEHWPGNNFIGETLTVTKNDSKWLDIVSEDDVRVVGQPALDACEEHVSGFSSREKDKKIED
jgi:hypothetical protein